MTGFTLFQNLAWMTRHRANTYNNFNWDMQTFVLECMPDEESASALHGRHTGVVCHWLHRFLVAILQSDTNIKFSWQQPMQCTIHLGQNQTENALIWSAGYCCGFKRKYSTVAIRWMMYGLPCGSLSSFLQPSPIISLGEPKRWVGRVVKTFAENNLQYLAEWQQTWLCVHHCFTKTAQLGCF